MGHKEIFEEFEQDYYPIREKVDNIINDLQDKDFVKQAIKYDLEKLEGQAEELGDNLLTFKRELERYEPEDYDDDDFEQDEKSIEKDNITEVQNAIEATNNLKDLEHGTEEEVCKQFESAMTKFTSEVGRAIDYNGGNNEISKIVGRNAHIIEDGKKKVEDNWEKAKTKFNQVLHHDVEDKSHELAQEVTMLNDNLQYDRERSKTAENYVPPVKSALEELSLVLNEDVVEAIKVEESMDNTKVQVHAFLAWYSSWK